MSTFGILPDFAQPELTQLIDALVASGFVEAPEVDRFRPVVQLTERGWNHLKNQEREPIEIVLSEELAAKVLRGGLDRLPSRPVSVKQIPALERTKPEAEEPGQELLRGDPLYEHLKALRLEWSRAEKRPAFQVMTNQTLEAIVRSRPSTPQALAAIKGFGAAKLERYGAALLAAISEFLGISGEPVQEPEPAKLAAPPPAVPSMTSGPLARSSNSYVPTEEWTWRLLDRGFNLDEVASIRGLDRSAVIRHATLAARQGKAVSPSVFLSAETLLRWKSWRIENGDRLPTAELIGAESADLWALFIAGSHSH